MVTYWIVFVRSVPLF